MVPCYYDYYHHHYHDYYLRQHVLFEKKVVSCLGLIVNIKTISGKKNQYCENDCTIKCNLQIQCDPYQTTNGIFHRTRTKTFTIHMETQKTLNSQSSLEKKNGTGGINLPDFRLYYKLQSSRQYGTGTKTEL